MSGKPKKLTPEAVIRIRRWYQQWASTPTATQMAKAEGIQVSTLLSVARGFTHKTVRQ